MDLCLRGTPDCSVSILGREPSARQQAQRPLFTTIVAEFGTLFEKYPCCPFHLTLSVVTAERNFDQITRYPALPQRSLDTFATPTREAALVLHIAKGKAPVINREVFNQVGHHPLGMVGGNFALRQPLPHLCLGPLLAPDRAQRGGKYFVSQSPALGGLLRGRSRRRFPDRHGVFRLLLGRLRSLQRLAVAGNAFRLQNALLDLVGDVGVLDQELL